MLHESFRTAVYRSKMNRYPMQKSLSLDYSAFRLIAIQNSTSKIIEFQNYDVIKVGNINLTQPWPTRLLQIATWSTRAQNPKIFPAESSKKVPKYHRNRPF